jgi:hypothetical protein
MEDYKEFDVCWRGFCSAHQQERKRKVNRAERKAKNKTATKSRRANR